MTERIVINRFKKNYDIAKKSKWIVKPYAWALYHTWKEIDVMEGERMLRPVFDNDGMTCEDCKFNLTLREDYPCNECVRMLREDMFTEVKRGR